MVNKYCLLQHTTQQVSNLVADTYTVTAIDPDNGCASSIQVTITEPAPVGVDTASTFIVNTPTVNDSVGANWWYKLLL